MSNFDPHATLMTPASMQEEIHRKVAVAFMEFQSYVTHYGESGVYVLVEGYDRGYYSHVIKSLTNRNRAFINCGGKSFVVKTRKYICDKPSYANYIILGFVDRDYDDNTSLGSDFCVTEGYSVENYYCCSEAMKEFYLSYCRINECSEADKLTELMNEYERWENDLFQHAQYFCAFHKVANPREKNDQKWKDRLKSLPQKFFTIDTNGIIKQPHTLQDLNDFYELKQPVSDEEHSEALASINSISDIRGKYVFQMLESFLNYLKCKIGKSKHLLKKQISFTTDRTNLIDNFAPYAVVPDSLRDYINRKVV